MEEHWEFAAASGERLEVHLKYERAPARKGASEVKFFSPTNPSSYQIFKVEQGIDIMRNATVKVRDRVKEFSYKAARRPPRAFVRRHRARGQHRLLPLVQSRRLSAVTCRGDIRTRSVNGIRRQEEMQWHIIIVPSVRPRSPAPPCSRHARRSPAT